MSDVNRHASAQLLLFGESALQDGELPEALADLRERDISSIALALGARGVAGWSEAEERVARRAPLPNGVHVKLTRRYIEAGRDPLGAAFCRIRDAERRRTTGATFTPSPIADAMLDWAVQHGDPTRVVDPGSGSGRFLSRAAQRFPRATLIGVEIDPLCAMIARANLAVAGHRQRSEIILGDFRSVTLPSIEARTLFIGNPPYVRHHLIPSKWKDWLTAHARQFKLNASQLAGLHVYFFLATVMHAKPGDFGAFITAAEWLDVNYGGLVRELFLGPLGGKRIVIVEPTARPFPDAATTAAVSYFEIGSKPASIKLKRVSSTIELKNHSGNRLVHRKRLETEQRWSHFTRGSYDVPSGFIELGELCRVHRGQVTGANKVWISGRHSENLPASVLFPTVTKARELFEAGPALSDVSPLRRVIDLPIDLDVLERRDRKEVERFLRFARAQGADASYVATNRRAWWSVGLREPAPVLATYMARRPPAFVRNLGAARHINIAHGLYPREVLADEVLDKLAEYLGRTASLRYGRTYAGGLTKFEPREMERLPVPSPAVLLNGGL